MSGLALHGEELTAALVQRLPAAVQALGAKLTGLDPGVNHMDTFGILVGPPGARHVLAIVCVRTVEVDGPGRAVPSRHQVGSQEALAVAAAHLGAVAESWLSTAAPRVGVFDLALTLAASLASDGFVAALSSSGLGAEGYVGARRDGVRWPVGLQLEATDAGVRLRCGKLDRVVQAAEDLADFAQAEGAELGAQLATARAIMDGIARAKPFATRLSEELARRFSALEWAVVTSEQYFYLTSEPAADVVWVKPDSSRATVASFVAQATGVRASALALAIDVPDLASFEEHVERLAGEAAAVTRLVRPDTLRAGSTYRARRTFAGVEPGTLLVFDHIGEIKPSGADCLFFSCGTRRLELALNDETARAVVDELDDYLELT